MTQHGGDRTKWQTFVARLPWQRSAIVVVALSAWCIAAILILTSIISWPYLGADITSGGRGLPTVVERVQPGGPADRAGLVQGDEITTLIASDGTRHPLTGFEAIPGREMLHSYEDANDARAAKALGWRLLNEDTIGFALRDGREVFVTPMDGRTLFSLHFQSFNLLLQALIILTIGAGILSFAPTTKPVLFLVGSGLGMGVNMMLNVVSASTELAMPVALWAVYDATVPVALVTFCFCLLALLWYFPSPITRFPFGLFLGVVWVLTVFGQQSQLYSFPLHPYQGPYLFTVVPAILIGIASWWRTRDDPLKRASVMWFVLSIMTGSLFAGMFYSLPVALGYPPLISTALTLFAVTLIYIGLALGTLRYRLFDIQRIWWRVITWMVGGLLVVLADILLIAAFDFEQGAALPLALFITGWVYFPLRQVIFGWFVDPGEIRSEDYTRDLIERFSRLEEPDSFDGGFALFLKTIFDAQDIQRVQTNADNGAALDDHGLLLCVPAVSGKGAIFLSGRQNGRRLFSLSDMQASTAMLELVRFMARAREREYDELHQERERIMRDLHDDVGGRLLSISYKADDPEVSATARETLSALKDTLFLIEDTQMVDVTVAWGKFRDDAQERLLAAGFKLNIEDAIRSERTFSAREYINLKRSMQEIVSNVIKYGDPSDVTARIDVGEDGLVTISVENTVVPSQVHPLIEGDRGLSNIRTRLNELGGDATVGHTNTVFRVDLRLPFVD